MKMTRILWSPRNRFRHTGCPVKNDDFGGVFNPLAGKLFSVTKPISLFQKIREYRVEERGEIRIGGCPCLGNGYLHGLRSAGDVHISRAGLLRDSGRGGQCDALTAGRAD